MNKTLIILDDSLIERTGLSPSEIISLTSLLSPYNSGVIIDTDMNNVLLQCTSIAISHAIVFSNSIEYVPCQVQKFNLNATFYSIESIESVQDFQDLLLYTFASNNITFKKLENTPSNTKEGSYNYQNLINELKRN